MSKGANIEVKGTVEETSLHIASIRGKTDIVKFLVSKIANKNGKTPYDLAWQDDIRNILK